jgi:hypothetical protein
MLESVVGRLTARVLYEVTNKAKKLCLNEPLVMLDVQALVKADYGWYIRRGSGGVDDNIGLRPLLLK